MHVFPLQPQYLIKYKGYPDSENTWEPVANLSCPRLIRKFEKDLENRQQNVKEYYVFERILAKRTVEGHKVSFIFISLFLVSLSFSLCVCVIYANQNIDPKRLKANFNAKNGNSVDISGRVFGEMGWRA